jgi:prolyl-tRNA synthetase
MKYSQLPFNTRKTVGEKLQSKNARLLTQAAFIHQEVAGVYTFLPLGLRVLSKIEQIIREEMDTIGVELLMTSLAPIDNWVKSKRFENVDVLMKTTPANENARMKNDTEYVLNPTHEDMITPLVMEFNRSYKDFPLAVYQIQTKFRNEPRAKSGLLRCREFRMKDLYSFHVSEEDLKKYYEKVKDTYWKIFDRLGFSRKDTFLTLASGGDFTKEYSHEFQTVCDAGEDIVFHVASENLTFNKEVAPAKAPVIDDSKEKEKPMQEVEGFGIIGVEDVAHFLKIPIEKTTKTLLFENEKGEIIAAAVRGGYDVHIEKLQKVSGYGSLRLASAKKIKEMTGAEVGYAGLLHLPENVKVFMDESMKGRKNFEMGMNKTHYHAININFGRDLLEPKTFYDIKIAKEGDSFPQTGEVYTMYKVAEIGNIFPLNTKFSNAFHFTYTDEKGNQMPVYMGSYGIGPSRILGVFVEKFADEKGLVWPIQVAPFHIHLICMYVKDETVKKKADIVYKIMQEKGIEVFYDDRDISAGEKFADADLLGIPYRVVISAKTDIESCVEYKERTKESPEFASLEALIARVKKKITENK